MKRKPYVKWKLNVWPDNFKIQATRSLAEYSGSPIFAGESVHWNYSFAIGFFGFHYVRAAKENNSLLEKESLQILHKLMIACSLEMYFLDYLKNPRDWEFLSFWDRVIKQISIALGDSLGPASQQMVELGFWLAAGYAGLVEQFNSDYEIACYLNNLEDCLHDLITSSYLAEIPEPLIKPLRDTRAFLEDSKNPEAVSKCMDTLRLTIENFLKSR